MMAESVVPNTTNEGGNHGTKAPSASGSSMAAKSPLAAAARVPNSTANDAVGGLAGLKAALAAKDREAAETTAKVDDLAARAAGLEESLEALRKEKECAIANIVGEKDKVIAELRAALAAKECDNDAGAGCGADPSTAEAAHAPAPTPRRAKAASSKARLGIHSPFASSSPIKKAEAKKAKAVPSRCSLSELNGDDDDDDEYERPARKEAARPSRGRSGRMGSSNVNGKHRGGKKTKRDFDVLAYKDPVWSKHPFFEDNLIKSKEDLIKFITEYKKRAHRGPLETKQIKWYPRAAKYEAEDFLRLLDNKNTEGKYVTGNVASLLDYFGDDEGEDFGSLKPYYNRAHRVASLLWTKWAVSSDRTTFDVHTRERDGNKGDAYIFERSRKFCTALNTMKTLHDIYTGEEEDVVAWERGDPITKPTSKKRARPTKPSTAEPATERPATKRPAIMSHTDDDESEDEGEGEDSAESEDEDEGESSSSGEGSSSGESAAPNEEEVAKHAEACLAVGVAERSHEAAVAKWYERFPRDEPNGPKPPWVDNEAWGHDVEAMDDDEVW